MENKPTYEFQKNALEKVIIQFSEFNKNKVIDIRVYYNVGNAAWLDFEAFCKPKIAEELRRYASSVLDTESAMGDILDKLIKAIQEKTIESSLAAYVKITARNHCKDIYRKKTRIREKAPQVLHDAPSSTPTIPGSKEYHGVTRKQKITSAYKRTIPGPLRKSIELSLEYIEELYKAKQEITLGEFKRDPHYQMWLILLKTKERALGTLGRRLEERISRYKELSEKNNSALTEAERKELKSLSESESKFDYIERINSLIQLASSSASSFELFRLGGRLMMAMPYSHDDLYSGIYKFKIEPPRLMFEIWSRAIELRKGQYADLKKIRSVFFYYKHTTKGTNREYLFEKLKDDMSNFMNVRQYPYRKPKGPFHKKLVRYIYKRSFVDGVSIKQGIQLHLLGMKEGWIEGGNLDDSLKILPESKTPKSLIARKRRLEKKD